MSSCTRPATSKPRGVCRYYNVPRGCFAGDKCKFLHGEPSTDPTPDDPPLLTPYDKAKRCRYFAQGFCKRGDACWFVHTVDSKDNTPLPAQPLDEDEEELCSICFEKPTTYGLLGGCSHIFCTTCIKQWRDPQNKPGGVLDSGNTKKCPMCRAPSKFITPSSRFWKEGTVEKTSVIRAYKESMARVPCRYFQKSMQKNKEKPICPYGKDCFYQHLKDDGTPYIFKDGVDVCMRKYRLSHGRMPFDDIHFMPFSLDLSSLDIVLPNLMSPQSIRVEPRVRDEGTQNHRGDTNSVAYAARRLREVGRSLELFNGALEAGATLDALDHVVRAGLGRWDGTNNNPEGRTHRRTTAGMERNRDEAVARQEDDVMERLELLADQMLASINALRVNGDGQGEGPRPDTPPPPLEPIEWNSAGTPPPPLIPAIERRRASPHDGNDSDSSLPALQSVSNSSEDEDDFSSDDESSDDGDDGSERYRDLELAGVQFGELFQGWASARLASAGGSTPGDAGVPASEAGSRPSVRFRTVVDRSQTQTPSRPNSVFDDMPPLETVERDSDAESDLAPPPLEPTEPLEPPADADRPGPPSNADPPFVTDGRGRVVWTRPGEDNKGERGVETRDEPTEETGRETGSGSGSSGATGRTILGWINALF